MCGMEGEGSNGAESVDGYAVLPLHLRIWKASDLRATRDLTITINHSDFVLCDSLKAVQEVSANVFRYRSKN